MGEHPVVEGSHDFFASGAAAMRGDLGFGRRRPLGSDACSVPGGLAVIFGWLLFRVL